MHGKQFSVEQNDALRALVREIVVERFGSNKSKAAEALGVTGAALGEFLASKRGIGNKLLSGLANLTGRSRGDLLGEEDTSEEPRWGSLQGFAESERALREAHPTRYSEALYRKARRLRGVLPLELPVSPAALRRLLNFLEENTALEELAALEEERLDAKLSADIKRADTRAKNKAAKASDKEIPLAKTASASRS